MVSNKTTLLVLGAGVSGLSSGILLLKAGYKVTIWAKDLPPNTTSDKAAAFWYPYLCNPRDKAVVWSKFTLEYLKKHAIDDPLSGCSMRTMIEVFDHKVDEPWWQEAVESYKRPILEELPDGYMDGYKVEAPLMDTSKYMEWLLGSYTSLGGTIQERYIASIDEAHMEYDTVINCTGLGSIELVNDNSLYPVRGQVVVVKPNGLTQITADDEAHNNLAYIIPRETDIVLGGTAQVGDWNLEVDPKDTEEILQKAKLLAPSLDKVTIIEEKVGLRPGRYKVRLEAENIAGKTVVHNYGHGGAGFTLSWGCAHEVLCLIQTQTRNS